MIAHQLSTRNGLIKTANSMAVEFCRTYKFNVIPIYLKDIPGVDGSFDDKRICIYLSPILVERFSRYTQVRAFYDFYRLMRHELEHYKDYIEGKPLRSREAERKADKISIIKAVDALERYTDEQINPILPEIDTRPKVDEEQLLSKIVNIASKPIPRNYKPSREQMARWKKLEKIFGERKPTKWEREEAFNKGMVI